MLGRAHYFDEPLWSSPAQWSRNLFSSGQIRSGQRIGQRVLDLFKGPLKNQSASVLASTRPNLDQRVGRANDSLFLLNYEERVPLVTHPLKYWNWPIDVPRMKSNARFMEPG